MNRGWLNTAMGMFCWGFGAGVLGAALGWPWGASAGLAMMGVPFVLFMFGKEGL